MYVVRTVVKIRHVMYGDVSYVINMHGRVSYVMYMYGDMSYGINMYGDVNYVMNMVTSAETAATRGMSVLCDCVIIVNPRIMMIVQRKHLYGFRVVFFSEGKQNCRQFVLILSF